MSRQPTRCPVCGTWMHDAPAKPIDGVRIGAIRLECPHCDWGWPADPPKVAPTPVGCCVVCRETIPRDRWGRGYATCSGPCENGRVQRIRRQAEASRKGWMTRRGMGTA